MKRSLKLYFLPWLKNRSKWKKEPCVHVFKILKDKLELLQQLPAGRHRSWNCSRAVVWGGGNTVLPLRASQPGSCGILSALHWHLQDGQARSNTASPRETIYSERKKDLKDSVDINPPIVTKRSKRRSRREVLAIVWNFSLLVAFKMFRKSTYRQLDRMICWEPEGLGSDWVVVLSF